MSTFNKIKMTDDTKINCPSKNSAIPISPNMGSFCPPVLGSHPQGLPPHPAAADFEDAGGEEEGDDDRVGRRRVHLCVARGAARLVLGGVARCCRTAERVARC